MSESVSITAKIVYNWDEDNNPTEVVGVFFGDVKIAEIPPAVTSRAGHGDDSTYFASEERRIVAETVAPVLEHIFDNALAAIAERTANATVYVERARQPEWDDIYGPFADKDAARRFMARRSLSEGTWVVVDRANEPAKG